MNTKKLLLALAAGCAISATAQEAPRSAYFLEGYSFRHELNPAFSGGRNYVSMPALANLNLGLFSNVGVNTFLYKTADLPGYTGSYKLTTFMSPNVGADEFLGKLSDSNHLNLNFDLTLLSAGFRSWGGYNTITISAHADAGLNLPKDLFRFMKQGQQGDTRYNFKDLQLSATSYAEIALGHSRQITDKLTAGAKIKALLGVGNATAKISDLSLRMSDQQWSVSAKGDMELSAGSGLYLPTKGELDPNITDKDERERFEFNDIDYDSFGLAGFGMGIDLGATYQLLPELQLSAAINDLGFIKWHDAYKGSTGSNTWTFEGFENVAVDKDSPTYGENKFDEQLDRITDDLEDLVNFHRTASGASYTKMLQATLHLGAEYTMPFYKGLTGAFLYSSHFGGCQSWHEGRFYANLKPCSWFNMSVNYGASTYGSSFGWMLNLCARGINFFVGSDHTFFKVTPQFVPVGNACANVNLGINFTFGALK